MTAIDYAWQPNVAKDAPADDEPPPEPPDDYTVPPEYGEQPAEEPEKEASALQRLADALEAELLDTYSLDKIKRNEYLVDGYLYRNTSARMNGASAAMKSFVMLDLAAHIATGRPWHGRKVKQGTVIYLVAEGAGGFEKRVRAWEQHHDVRAENLYILPRAVQVSSGEWQVLIEVCKRRKAAFVVCDTQARVTVGIEENSAKEMGVVIDRIEQMREATGACVSLVHHEGVQGERGRGSTSVKGAMQTELRVSRTGKGLQDTRITVANPKQKDEEEAGDLVFALEQQVIEGMFNEDGNAVTSVVLVPGEPVEGAGSEDPGKQARSEWKAESRVRNVLLERRVDGGAAMTVDEIGNVLAADLEKGPLKKRTIQVALKTLSEQNAAEVAGMRGVAQLWQFPVPGRTQGEIGDA